ncbi:MAG TPA: molybdopterin-dependent oxidoreductase [Acidimicrobiia bacterium]|nr:molybdopterin-dependent oxidoreductase [Acidimicrobiia bacterium]
METSLESESPSFSQSDSQATGRFGPALFGAVSVALSFGISELLAGAIGAPSLIQGVADWVVDSAPPGLKDWAIATFGTNDKPALLIGIVTVGLLLGGAVGLISRRRLEPVIIAFGAFGILAATATASNPAAGTTGPWLIAIVSVTLGLIAFRWLTRRTQTAGTRPSGETDQSRRSFLQATSIGGLALVSAGVGRILFSSNRAAASQQSEVTVNPGTSDIPVAASFDDVEGLTPVVVPNADFYRIDTAIVVPRVDLAGWSLSFSGMVDNPYSINFDELMELPMVERYVTLSCVSNEVGGKLVGNARWLGVPLKDLLDRAGVQAGADQLVARSVDDFTVGFPTAAAIDGREALLAVGMNGEALPLEHGFPARLVVSGLYGYVSATKWISEIELTTWDSFDAYWVPRGWSKEAPIKTQSRIDTPARRIEPGDHYIAGVAWSPNVGITRVEVEVDTGGWRSAELTEPLSEDAWVQWRLLHNFGPGSHRIRVRATDATGFTQGENHVPPAPNGAEGWHTISVTVA